jgi:two-component system sensor histidine kinase DesK
MTVALAPPTRTAVFSRPVPASRVVVEQDARQRSHAVVRLATTAVVVYNVFLPLVNVVRLSLDPVNPQAPPSDLIAALATAVYLPLQLWLVLASLRDRHHRGQRWAAAGVTVVVLGMIPVLGVDWLGAVYLVVIAALLVLRMPWSLLAVAALFALVVTVSLLAGRPDAAVFFGAGPPLIAVTAGVPIWLIRSVRRLAATQTALAETAVTRERVRIADELRPTIDLALVDIVAAGDRAAVLAGADVPAAERQLQALAERSRRTLSDVRRMTRGFQKVSLRGEVETAATLLRASGIPTVVRMLTEDLPDGHDAVRGGLRNDVARALRNPPTGGCVLTVSMDGGRPVVRLLGRAVPPGGAAAELTREVDR